MDIHSAPVDTLALQVSRDSPGTRFPYFDIFPFRTYTTGVSRNSDPDIAISIHNIRHRI